MELLVYLLLENTARGLLLIEIFVRSVRRYIPSVRTKVLIRRYEGIGTFIRSKVSIFVDYLAKRDLILFVVYLSSYLRTKVRMKVKYVHIYRR